MCEPTKPDKLMLFSWYNFRRRKGRSPKPVKINRRSVLFRTRLEMEHLTEYIITSYCVLLQNVIPCLGRLVLCICCFEIPQKALFSVCGGLNQQTFLLSQYQRLDCGFNLGKKHLEAEADLLKLVKKSPRGIWLGARKVDNSFFHSQRIQRSAASF